MATFHQISSQNLECPVCLTLFNQPKLLTCSHTFCKDCLECILQTQPGQHTITCPLCMKGTSVPSGDVSRLQTNVPLNSLVDEVKTRECNTMNTTSAGKTKSPTCTVCDTEEKPPAVSYCQECGKNMCEPCEVKHSSWTPFANHAVVPMKGHGMVEVSTHKEKVMENIKDFKKRIDLKKTTTEKYIESIESQRKIMSDFMKNLNDDIDKTYDECIEILSQRKKALNCQVERWFEKYEKELQVMEEESREKISHINTLEELIGDNMKVPPGKDTLLAHDTLYADLQSILGQDDPDDQSPRSVAERARKISFRKHVKVNELCLGDFEGYSWDLKAEAQLKSPMSCDFLEDSTSCMTAEPDGRMAVGMCEGGILLYSPNGELQETVLKDVKIARIGFLSDGRCVVLDSHKKMSLYTQQWEKLRVKFQTSPLIFLITVDGEDNIYVGFLFSNKIQVFTPLGGKAVREMLCDGHAPSQMFSFQTAGNLIVNDGKNIVCLDSRGKKENAIVMKKGAYAYPAVCRDDSVIVAWVQHEEGLLSIDRYTRDLQHAHNIVTDFQLCKQRNTSCCYLQEFQSGEIAFCNVNKLYIFRWNKLLQ
ncbi:uncharacterized protein [Diadema antillarum]|uniref:uncharacterized protein n=1 Tax=Diadema antillarum TaxID=105358 RepID=UPI003A8ABF2E